MQKKDIQELYKELVGNLTNKGFLKKIKYSKKAMLNLLKVDDWKKNIERVIVDGKCSCTEILEVAGKTMDEISEPPEGGWFDYIYNCTLNVLFPEHTPVKKTTKFEVGKFFYLEVLQLFLRYEKRCLPYDPKRNMLFLSADEAKQFGAGEEYAKFTSFCRENYIYEFMRIGRETTPFDTLGHIAGVHHICMHVARQLHRAGVPIDLALVSGAAAGHDIGKYGCRPKEAKRIPYLHYYYTDLFFRREEMPTIGHIATNHSTWDLELENLSAESLVLIYADFRVKGTRNEKGEELIHFYSLKDSFDVILNKLDNVDKAKEERYRHVYAKLRDFEKYMESLGVDTDLSRDQLKPVEAKDVSLYSVEEVVEKLKYLAIEHNISLMHKMNSETSYGNLLEAARSEKDWKNIRAYLNIFREYFTYMTQKQKIITINFLHELLMHREGDIRRQAADLIGHIIVSYDEEYRKEIPEDASLPADEVTSITLWQKTLESIVFPDHKVTEQHRRWIGYTLKIVVTSVLRRCKLSEKQGYLNLFMDYYKNLDIDDDTAFILLDSISLISFSDCSNPPIADLIHFAEGLVVRDSLEIRICALRFLKHVISEAQGRVGLYGKDIHRILDQIDEHDAIALAYLKYKIFLDGHMKFENSDWYESFLYNNVEAVSNIFLENLKVATPWVIKVVNIELLLDLLKKEHRGQVLHIATHLSNLIKVSERVAVRHNAGEALLAIAPFLTLDQRNEIAIELTKGLEIGEYEFSKYIPEYLGELALFLHPNELDEFLQNLKHLMESANNRVGSVALNTLGILIGKYVQYQERYAEPEEVYEARRKRVLGMILRGMANYHDVISQEAFLVIGQYIFGNSGLGLKEKYDIFRIIYKKMLTLIVDQKETELSFFNNAASLNHIYRFISEYSFYNGDFHIDRFDKVAFFPGTFDPFSLSHKGIVTEIRNLGFEVYLALDEFSWSKKTQPRMIRRRIINMSVADEADVYLFPDNIPINIANPSDLSKLGSLFQEQMLYLVVGSDVVINASSYWAEPHANSVHSLNHVVFHRDSDGEGTGTDQELQQAYENIKGNIVELKLPTYLEDISSTRIRENIDLNRDISNLIDPVAQNFIYDNSLYLREPQYKYILETKSIRFELYDTIETNVAEEIFATLMRGNHEEERLEHMKDYLRWGAVSGVLIRDGERGNEIVGFVSFHGLSISDLFHEFQDANIAAHIRQRASGRIVVLTGIFASERTERHNIYQLALTEVLAYALKGDYSYAVYHDIFHLSNDEVQEVLDRQGFLKVEGCKSSELVYEVDIRFPITLLQNMETTLKEPFNHSEGVLEVMEKAYRRLQIAVTKLYPGNLVLSFNASVMHHRLVDMITKANGVPSEPLKVRKLGDYMCVPFGKILRAMAVPNTVTKALHTEKVFNAEVRQFDITEFPYYSPLDNQIRTIKSFNREVILVDDLLHKGYRMKKLDPLFKQEHVKINRIMVGILSGQGKDLMTIQNREVDSVYFVPNLRVWFVESTIYPFIGGDSIDRGDQSNASLLPSVNLILPYVAPAFIGDASQEAIYDFSMTCLMNARDILVALEEEYQRVFERNLTLNRLSEAIISPRCPDMGLHMGYDPNLAPSVYLCNDIEKLTRLRDALVK